MKKEKYNIAIVGATGAVGEQLREVLEDRQFPVDELRLLASERSAGQFLPFQGRQVRVSILKEDSFKKSISHCSLPAARLAQSLRRSLSPPAPWSSITRLSFAWSPIFLLSFRK